VPASITTLFSCKYVPSSSNNSLTPDTVLITKFFASSAAYPFTVAISGLDSVTSVAIAILSAELSQKIAAFLEVSKPTL